MAIKSHDKDLTMLTVRMEQLVRKCRNEGELPFRCDLMPQRRLSTLSRLKKVQSVQETDLTPQHLVQSIDKCHCNGNLGIVMFSELVEWRGILCIYFFDIPLGEVTILSYRSFMCFAWSVDKETVKFLWQQCDHKDRGKTLEVSNWSLMACYVWHLHAKILSNADAFQGHWWGAKTLQAWLCISENGARICLYNLQHLR